MTEYPEGEDPIGNLNEAEPLSNEDRKNAFLIIDIFGEDIAQKLFSRTWQIKEEGLNILDDILMR
jgi:hypothetical protein